MPAVTPLPTLSQVQSLDTGYLREAGDYFKRTGTLWDEVFTEIHDRMSTPGGTPWIGQAADKAQERALTDMLKVRPASYQLQEAAGIARRGDEQLEACKQEVLEAVREARGAGFDVGEDYSVTDRSRGGSAEYRAERCAQAQGHAAFIRHRVAALVATDQEITAQIAAATTGIDNLTFTESPGVDDTTVGDDKPNGVQLVDHHTRLPERPPHPEPDPPPGGWSSDPLMRAAQKIAYGHAGGKHAEEFSGMTKDQLANVIDDMFKRSSENPGSLLIGRTSDGAPVLYDPKTNVMVIRDPNALDAGTVYKPKVPNLENYLRDKVPTKVPSLPPGELADGPLSASAQPGAPKPPGDLVPPKSPVEAAPPVKPSPGTAEGGGRMPGLPFGGSSPYSPATGPHPVYPPGHHPHQLPLAGEDPEEVP